MGEQAPLSRVCRECGADTWKAAGYDELNEARDRHWRKNREQAIVILTLQLRVAELEERERGRQRKVTKQARVIRRLEDRLRALSQFPYEGFNLGDTESVPQDIPATEGDGIGPSPRGMRQLRKNVKEATDDASETGGATTERDSATPSSASPSAGTTE